MTTRHRPHRRHDLAEVARIYDAAIKAHQPTTKTIAEHFDLSHSAAAKLVMRSRAAGHLPPTIQGGAPKGHAVHRPTIAVVHRNHSTERKFLVCDECLEHWPCDQAALV